MYDPLSSTVVVRSSTKSAPSPSTSVKTGMSVMQLQELLTPSKRAHRTKNARSFSSSSCGSPRQVASVHDRMRAIERATEQQEAKRRAMEALESGYTSAVFNPPRERRPVRFLPPADQTTAQLIDKYRKLAVGKLPDTS